MAWRVLLTVAYGAVFGVLTALGNLDPEMTEVPLIVVWAAAPVVGFLVGRWVLFAVVGVLVGRTIGWDSGEHDGNPALWPAYVVSTIVLVGVPLLVGVALSLLYANTSRSRRFWGSE